MLRKENTRILLILTAIVALFLCSVHVLETFSKVHFGGTESDASSEALPDGKYTVGAVLKGGTGRVSIESPVQVEVEGGKITATFIWTSSFYEYMLVEGEKFLPESRDKKNDTTTFRIPLQAIKTFEFVAQTSRMSRPYDIEYSIEFDRSTLKKEGSEFPLPALISIGISVVIIVGVLARRIAGKKTKFVGVLVLLFAAFTLNGCNEAKGATDDAFQNALEGIKWIGSEEVAYASGFKIDYFEHNIALIRIKEQAYLVIPRNLSVRKESDKDYDAKKITANADAGSSVIRLKSSLDNAVIIKRPEKIYLTAPAALALIHDIGAMKKIRYTGTKVDSWSLDYAIEAMNKGEMVYAGKYSSPDFERLVNEKCDLTVFSTMITHAPEIGEKFIELGIPIFIDYSSYEQHPLGRTEWIKVYGALLNKKEEADKVFAAQREMVEKLTENQPPQEGAKEKVVALFMISPSGRISARRYDDYVSKMIDIAGGKYAYHDVSDVQISAMNIIMEPEVFFKETSKADIIIYNSTIGGGYDSIAAMTETNPVLADLPAVKAGEVWITTKSFFQSSTSHGNMILELNQIIKGEADEDSKLEFFKKIK